MFTFIFAALLVLAGAGEAEQLTEFCDGDKGCVSLRNATLTAEAGLCVVIPCFMNVTGEVKSITWKKCKEKCEVEIFSSKENNKVETQFKERVSLLNSDQTKNSCSIIITDVTKEDNGTYKLSITRGNKPEYTFTAVVNIHVTDLTQTPTLNIPRLVEGQNATLTCTAPGRCSGPVPRFTWTWRREGQRDVFTSYNVTKFKTKNQTHSSTLTFTASAEHNNTQVGCEVSFGGGSATETVGNLRVYASPQLSNSSGCSLGSDVLNCACVSEAFPASAVKWPQLNKSAEYWVLTTGLKQGVSGNVSGIDLHNATLRCASNNLSKQPETGKTEDDLVTEFLRMITQLRVIVAFLIGLLLGIILTSFITCLARKCRRKKQRSASILDDLQMVNIQAVSGMDVEATERGDERPPEVEYSDINFSALKTKEGAEAAAAVTPAAETEYAEIKKDNTDGEDAGEEAEATSEEEKAMMGREEGTPAEEGGGEEVALYATVQEIMEEI